jgi:hypothetical protein
MTALGLVGPVLLGAGGTWEENQLFRLRPTYCAEAWKILEHADSEGCRAGFQVLAQ